MNPGIFRKIDYKSLHLISVISVLIIFSGVLILFVYENKSVKKTFLNCSRVQAQSIANQYVNCLDLEISESEIGSYLQLFENDSINEISIFNTEGNIIKTTDKEMVSLPEVQKIVDTGEYKYSSNILHINFPIYRNSKYEGTVYIKLHCPGILINNRVFTGFSFMLLIIFISTSLLHYKTRSVFNSIARFSLHIKSNLGKNNPEEYIEKVFNKQLDDLFKSYSLMVKKYKRRDHEVKSVLDELKKSEEEYQKLYENAPDMYFSVTVDSKEIIRCNNTICKYTGYSKEEVLSKSVFSLFADDSLEEAKIYFSGICLTENYKPELEIRKKNGELINVVIDNTAVNDEDGNVLYLNVVMRDLSSVKETEIERQKAIDKLHLLLKQADKSRRALLSVVEDQKSAKDELSKLNISLENIIAERTEKLIIANKELEAFSYSVSHDLRAPLRHINGFINLFLDKVSFKLSEQEASYLNIVIKSSREMGELIDSLLSFAKLSRTGIKLDYIEMKTLVLDALDFFNSDIVKRKIKVSVSDFPEVKGDSKLIKQVWINLISNAIKYTGKTGFPEIEIGVNIEKDEYAFFIKDNGEGFNMKYISKLYGVFQRLHKTNEHEGVGIGLANVNSIINKHGGRCWANSELGKGATFFFSLPKP